MEREREQALGSLPLVGAPIPSMGAPPSWPGHLPKALLPNTIFGMRVGASTRGFWRDTCVQSMALASTEGAELHPLSIHRLKA